MRDNPTLLQRAKSIEKVLRTDKYSHNQLRKVFCTGQNLLKNILRKYKY